MLLKTSVSEFINRVYRSKGGLWFPDYDHVVDPKNNVLAVLGTLEGKIIIPACNIVTDAGDVYYAQRGAAETPTNTFNQFEMASAAATGHPSKTSNRSNFTLIASTLQAEDTGFPKTNDTDPDNTGAGTDVVTHKTTYSTASFSHSAITHGIITNPTPAASEPILTGWAWASSINKTTNDTLKAIVNHTMNGV